MPASWPSTAPERAGEGPTVNDDLLDGRLPAYRLYEPQEVCIVMGAGRRAEEDVYVERAVRDRVPVLRRRGGGGTVVLSPGQVVLALVAEVASPFQNLEYFHKINGWFRRTLESLGLRDLEERGISDLAVGGCKILGTSLYRRRLLLFYQASLLVSNDLALLERYLRFPSRVPDYRDGRSHGEFCTTLRRQGCPAAVEEVIAGLRDVVEVQLPKLR